MPAKALYNIGQLTKFGKELCEVIGRKQIAGGTWVYSLSNKPSLWWGESSIKIVKPSTPTTNPVPLYS